MFKNIEWLFFDVGSIADKCEALISHLCKQEGMFLEVTCRGASQGCNRISESTFARWMRDHKIVEPLRRIRFCPTGLEGMVAQS